MLRARETRAHARRRAAAERAYKRGQVDLVSRQWCNRAAESSLISDLRRVGKTCGWRVRAYVNGIYVASFGWYGLRVKPYTFVETQCRAESMGRLLKRWLRIPRSLPFPSYTHSRPFLAFINPSLLPSFAFLFHFLFLRSSLQKPAVKMAIR